MLLVVDNVIVDNEILLDRLHESQDFLEVLIRVGCTYVYS
jgi:hypothetical protein